MTSVAERGTGRLARLAEELEELGLPKSGRKGGSESFRAMLLEEVDHAMRPDVHERQVASTGSVLDPRAEPAEWEPGTQLELPTTGNVARFLDLGGYFPGGIRAGSAARPGSTFTPQRTTTATTAAPASTPAAGAAPRR